MGTANLVNLADVWIDLLYAKGRLTIAQAVESALKRCEFYAGDDGHDSSAMVSLGFMQTCEFLRSTKQQARAGGFGSWWGWDGDPKTWAGPYVEPILDAAGVQPRACETLPPELIALLQRCSVAPDDAQLHSVTAAAIEVLQQPEWAAFVRDLPKIRKVYRMWSGQEIGYDDDEHAATFDRVPWRFCDGKRAVYREMPRPGRIER